MLVMGILYVGFNYVGVVNVCNFNFCLFLWVVGDVIKMVEINCGFIVVDDCYDKVVLMYLKVVVIVVILSISVLGVLIFFFGRCSWLFRMDGNFFMVVKVFVVGVILVIVFVYMLFVVYRVLLNFCFLEDLWGKFVWVGFIIMLVVLGILVMDFVVIEFYMNCFEYYYGYYYDLVKIEDFEYKNGKLKYFF